MKQKFVLLFAMTVMILLSGCGQQPDVNFNAEMNKNIHKITVAPPNTIKDLKVFYYNHPGLKVGGIFGLAALAEFGIKESEYNKLVKSEDFDTNAYFLSKLKENLEKEKYSVVLLPADPKRKNEFMKEYPQADTDAYLDLKLEDMGYIAGSPAAAYKPTIIVRARLVKKNDKAIVFDRILAVGENYNLNEGVDFVGCVDENCYSDFAGLKENSKQSIDGLKKSLDKIAEHLAFSLKRSE